MPTALTISQYGMIVVDSDGNLLWDMPLDNPRFYGLDIDPYTGNFYVASFGEILELTRTGRIVWRYSSHETKALHSLQLTPRGILVSATLYDRVLEIDKKEGVIWKWDAADHFTPPPGHKIMNEEIEDGRWTHLNHAWRLKSGETLIGMYHEPRDRLPTDYPEEDKPDGQVLLVDEGGKILWSWGVGITLHQHYIIPYREGYIIADSGNERLIYTKNPPSEGVIKYVDLPGQPLSIDVKPDDSLLVSIPAERMVCEYDKNFELVWKYKIPNRIDAKVSVAKYLPEWTVDYTEEERAVIDKRLRGLGYIE